jgi:hypothetical protein
MDIKILVVDGQLFQDVLIYDMLTLATNENIHDW